jgi:hypothetical protein
MGGRHFGGTQMMELAQNVNRPTAKGALPSAWRMFFLFSSTLFLGTLHLHAQCPNTGQTTVIKPSQGTGYYFYRFLGDSSFVYFLDGKTFSLNGKDDPGRTFIFIDDMVYESNLVDRADFARNIKGSKPIDILRAQAKYEQDYFKSADPSMVITDYGPASRKNPDGSDDRLFYLWKKENPPGKEAATQYMYSTLIKDGVVVLSIILKKASVSEDDVFLQIQKYTSHFDEISSDQCAKVLSTPSAP